MSFLSRRNLLAAFAGLSVMSIFKPAHAQASGSCPASPAYTIPAPPTLDALLLDYMQLKVTSVYLPPLGETKPLMLYTPLLPSGNLINLGGRMFMTAKPAENDPDMPFIAKISPGCNKETL